MRWWFCWWIMVARWDWGVRSGRVVVVVVVEDDLDLDLDFVRDLVMDGRLGEGMIRAIWWGDCSW